MLRLKERLINAFEFANDITVGNELNTKDKQDYNELCFKTGRGFNCSFKKAYYIHLFVFIVTPAIVSAIYTSEFWVHPQASVNSSMNWLIQSEYDLEIGFKSLTGKPLIAGIWLWAVTACLFKTILVRMKQKASMTVNCSLIIAACTTMGFIWHQS